MLGTYDSSPFIVTASSYMSVELLFFLARNCTVRWKKSSGSTEGST